MRKIIAFILLSVCCYTAVPATNPEMCRQTFVYSVKGNDTLRLDKYDIPSGKKEKPCVIFVFGGGFTKGKRDHDYNAAYLQNLAKSGYVAVGIDYRLGLKNVDATKIGGLNDVIGLLRQAISIAVEDLFDATRFVYDHAGEWNINREMIIANGSSAGAVTVLHGEYLISNKSELTEKLPENFRYAGIVSFAGAILIDKPDLTWADKPAPILLFHGDADKNVPYHKVEVQGVGGFYGSKYISEKLVAIEAPHYFYDVTNAAHEIAGEPMTENMEEINSFITKYVLGKEPLIIHTQMRQIGKPEMEKNFTIADYIQTNYM